jgi:hypothetical protein
MTNKSDADHGQGPSKEFEDQASVGSSRETLNRSPQSWIITEYNEAVHQRYLNYMALFDSTDAIPKTNKEKVRSQIVTLVHNATRYQAWDTASTRIFERLGKSEIFLPLLGSMFLAIPSLLLPSVPLWIRVGISAIPLLYIFIIRLMRRFFPQIVHRLTSYVQTPPERSYIGQIIGTLVSVLIVYLAIRYNHQLKLATLGRIALQLFIGIIAMYIAAVIIVPTAIRPFDLLNAWLKASLMIALSTLLIVAATLLNPSWSPWILHALRSSLLITAILVAGYPLALLSSYAFFGYLERRVESKYPRSVIVTSALDVLEALERGECRGGASGGGGYVSNHEIAHRLGIMASTIEICLSQHLTDRDISINSWLQGRIREIAQAIREQKKSIILSGRVECDALKKRIGWYIVITVTGEWTLLDHVQVDTQARPSSRRRFTTAVRWLATTLWPLVALVAIANAPVSRRETLLAAFLPFAISWIGIQLISLLDPRAEERLAKAVDISSKLPSPKE